MKMEQTVCSVTPTHKIQTPENHPKERLEHSEQGGSLKSRIVTICLEYCCMIRYGISTSEGLGWRSV
jgi:hypothetical protein